MVRMEERKRREGGSIMKQRIIVRSESREVDRTRSAATSARNCRKKWREGETRESAVKSLVTCYMKTTAYMYLLWLLNEVLG